MEVHNDIRMLLRSTNESVISCRLAYLGWSSETHAQEHRNRTGRDVLADSYQQVDLGHGRHGSLFLSQRGLGGELDSLLLKSLDLRGTSENNSKSES